MSISYRLTFNKLTVTDTDYNLISANDGLVLLMNPTDIAHTVTIPLDWATKGIFHVKNISSTYRIYVRAVNSAPIFGTESVIIVLAGEYANFTCIRAVDTGNDAFIHSFDTQVLLTSQIAKKMQYAGFYIDANYLDNETLDPTLNNTEINLCIGGDGTYTASTSVLTFNGTSFTVVPSTGPFDVFANGSAGTMIYFGDTNRNVFYGIGYQMSTQALVADGMVYIWEYFDGGINDWVELPTMQTLTGYTNFQGIQNWLGADGNNYTVRFSYQIDEGIISKNSAATGSVATTINGVLARWIRCRITTPGGVSFRSPRISGVVKFKGSFVNLRNNRTISYHGKRRLLLKIPVVFIPGASTANETIDVSPNISIPFQKNEFIGAANDALYWYVQDIKRIDFSSGICLLFKYYASTSVDNQDADFDTYVSHNSIGDKFDGTSAEISRSFVINVNLADQYVSKVSDRYFYDISSFNPEDTIYGKLARNGVADVYNGNIVIASIWIEAYGWSNGDNDL
jgi:hypothetical protein